MKAIESFHNGEGSLESDGMILSVTPRSLYALVSHLCLTGYQRSQCHIRTCGKGRGTLGILLFIAGIGRKAYWKRGGGGEGEGAEPIQ